MHNIVISFLISVVHSDRLFIMFTWSLLLLFLHSFGSFVSGLQFGYTPPTQCDSLTVSWADGEPPYELLLVPVSSCFPDCLGMI